MLKNIISVVVGYVLWTTIFFGGGFAVRSAMPDIHDENGITGNVSALLIYLLISIVASLAAGYATAWIANLPHKGRFALILAACLLATGIPVQLSAWDDLPVWYNLAFLILLVPVTLLGAKLARRSE